MDVRYDEPLVGSVSIGLAIVALVIAVGPWTSPYQLRTVRAVNHRFGKPAARGLWMIVAAAALASGLAIFNGVRPSYAVPTNPTLQSR